jgi:hypothetical protein
MTKYLVEVYHSPDKIECLHTIQIFLSSGSHFLTHADWGCLDGEHKAWFIIDVDSKGRSSADCAFILQEEYKNNKTKQIQSPGG